MSNEGYRQNNEVDLQMEISTRNKSCGTKHTSLSKNIMYAKPTIPERR